ALAHLRSIPRIVIDGGSAATREGARVAIATASFGVMAPGTVYRMDDVPLPLRPVVSSALPTDKEVLAALLAAL
ncbi:MAG TPA: formylmethanofuran dehydrogenase subunit B, partial [Pirellulales bacterium]|nr:formylmethanofuran dehydrogenase subunit B [Pirellulales bacterium]